MLLVVFAACSEKRDAPGNFTEAALNSTMTNVDGQEVSLAKILDENKGKPVVVDVWASWCPDCIAGMPKVKDLQQQFPNVTYMFLSFDKSREAWKNGIEKYNVEGRHYLIGYDEWKGGTFSESIELDWIPRYMVLDKDSNIAFYYAKEADNKELIATLNKLNQ